MFRVFHLAWSTCRATKTFVVGWRTFLRKVERGSTLSNKFCLCCSFFIKLTTCHATNLLMMRDKLRIFASRISPPLVRMQTNNYFSMLAACRISRRKGRSILVKKKVEGLMEAFSRFVVRRTSRSHRNALEKNIVSNFHFCSKKT
jgi:hypothetical protein